MKLWDLAKRFISRKSTAPFYFVYFITARCNARCQHCFYWKEVESADAKKELSLEEIEKVSKTMGNIYFLSLTGGEPFVRNDLFEIVKIFVKNNKVSHLTIPTNGLLTGQIKTTVEKILKSFPKLAVSINISLDGKESLHDKIRGVKGCFKSAVKTYNTLRPFKKQYKNLNLRFVAAVSKANQESIQEFYDYVKTELNADLSLVLVRGSPKNAKLKDIDVSFYEKMQGRIMNEDKFKKKSLWLNLLNYPVLRNIIRFRMSKLREQMIVQTVRNNDFIAPCYAGELNAVMYENGEIAPCEMLDIKFGNVKDFNYDFQKIWNSKGADKARAWIKGSKCFCTHECNLTSNILFNPKFLIKILRRKL